MIYIIIDTKNSDTILPRKLSGNFALGLFLSLSSCDIIPLPLPLRNAIINNIILYKDN
jgi:hypothetical protein